jgi:hypothetical protein
MTFADLLSQLDQLDREDQFRVIDHLMHGLEQEAGNAPAADELTAEARWDTSFAKSQDMLARMAAKARQHRDQGLNQVLDPDTL